MLFRGRQPVAVVAARGVPLSALLQRAGAPVGLARRGDAIQFVLLDMAFAKVKSEGLLANRCEQKRIANFAIFYVRDSAIACGADSKRAFLIIRMHACHSNLYNCFPSRNEMAKMKAARKCY